MALNPSLKIETVNILEPFVPVDAAIVAIVDSVDGVAPTVDGRWNGPAYGAKGAA